MRVSVVFALALTVSSAARAQPVFDDHVHLAEGEMSLRDYEAQVKAAGIDEVGFGGMWFGGPNTAPVGHPAQNRSNNDAQWRWRRPTPR